MVLLETTPNHIDESNNPSLRPQIVGSWRLAHEGNPKETLLNALAQVKIEEIDRIACTGRKFRELINLSTIAEPVAVEVAYRFLKPAGVNCPAIVSAGGETFMVYVLNRAGQIVNVLTGNRCASGTGEFFVQQLRRLNISLNEAADWPVTESPYQVSGRCSVFCKSDCTHATNQGIAKSRVAAGLCQMMADRVTSLLTKVPRRHIMLTGGTVHNQMMREYLGREIEDIIVPDAADCFEALGAALWALKNETTPFPGKAALFNANRTSFATLPPLRQFKDRVTFNTLTRGEIRVGDTCILGLDVGSTTTKAVLMRESDDAILSSVYLRTNGDPVGAARSCYADLLAQVSEKVTVAQIAIIGLGVCGSGRQIAGLHALTDGVINEIIAHAAAAVYFDPQVDTLFEIGGQDAKYTHITNGVPSDYAMNEACSAGTGSFLEESAFETLGIAMAEIESIALAGNSPPNFNDQCAAFIASDIKTAIHEGIGRTDIVAGLVYSICMNYTNRVKGNRPVGRKIFMQGGVCYNKAVPLAMAALVGKPIVVPPEPGLMGAFGVALEVKNRIRNGSMQAGCFDLKTLADRSVTYGKSFTCNGGREKCDRRCTIAVVSLAGKRYPFGGACNRYYNMRHQIHRANESVNLVRARQHLVFAEIDSCAKPPGQTIALNRSFMVNTYYPFYAAFFNELGLSVMLPDTASREGIDRRGSAFCYPGELAHGFFHTLLAETPTPDFIFLPHFKSFPSGNGDSSSQVCPFVQGETYYLKTAFRNDIEKLEQQGMRILSPVLDMAKGLDAANSEMLKVAATLGRSRHHGQLAFQKALAAQQRFHSELKALGRRLLSDLEATPGKSAVVLFGRAYNAFAPEAHMSIPDKFASRGIPVIPFDALPFEAEPAKRHMYWGTGRQLLQAARLVWKHPQLFGVYVTNFSCGPDSFLIGYFREIMGQKPALTLELDSHTADAGLETRVEAFLDIVAAYSHKPVAPAENTQTVKWVEPTFFFGNGVPMVMTASGEKLSCLNPRVTLLIPSMGQLATQALAAAFRGSGFNAVAHPPADEAVLKLGRANTTCKECLPLILTTGSLLNYIRNQKRSDEVLLYFMATASGPCRFGQYYVFMEDLIRREKISNVAMFSLTAENGYMGLKNGSELRGWWAIIISDVMEDIRAMLLAAAEKTEFATAKFEEIWQNLLLWLEKGKWEDIQTALFEAARQLKQIPLKKAPAEVPLIGLVGEIFVRRDGLSRQWLTEHLAEKGFAAVCSPIAEWLHYCDYLFHHDLVDNPPNAIQKIRSRFRRHFKTRFERRIKSILSESGLIQAHPIRLDPIINAARPYLSANLTGEAVLTVGSSLADVAERFCGIISIGPFGCMPSRLSEAILSEIMTVTDKLSLVSGNGHLRAVLSNVEDLPFLAVESDGSPFPHQITAKLEAFCLRALRLHDRMRSVASEGPLGNRAAHFYSMPKNRATRARQ
jgi:predicted CoA-substrate-specific enzyme activase